MTLPHNRDADSQVRSGALQFLTGGCYSESSEGFAEPSLPLGGDLPPSWIGWLAFDDVGMKVQG